MKSTLEKLKATFGGRDSFSEDFAEDYVEISAQPSDRGAKAKVLVRPFIIEDFADVKPVLDSLRDGYTVALINIKPLKDRDLVELKRAVNKIKKTCDAVDGDIAGFGDDWICVTPSFAEIYRDSRASVEPTAPKRDATGMEDEF